ncbi:MAG: PIN domain-containing protein [Chthoniobacteraceae bacterium]
MKLVDTSAWIHQLRSDGDTAVRHRVDALLHGGQACWCPVVRLELWMGARGDREKAILRQYEQALPELGISDEVWKEAFALARAARAAGLTCPSPDVLIAACARHHGLEVEAADHHFPALMAL